MKLGYTMAAGRGDTDLVMARLAQTLAAQGLRPCGLVQTNSERPDRHHCDMDVRVLPDGPVIRISQALGTGSRGCRLDPGALEQAVAEVAARLSGSDVLIINKFGKHEAEGHGFRDLIAEALARGIPVVTGVNALNLEAFLGFSAGLAEALPPDPARLSCWVLAAHAAAHTEALAAAG